MRHLGITLAAALLAALALGALAASALAVEISGWLFLEKEEAPVKITGTGGESTIIGKKGEAKFKCSTVNLAGTSNNVTNEEETKTHVLLGVLDIDFEGCKSEKGAAKLACSSENAKGEKDAKEVILISSTIADSHIVALLEGATLLPGFYILLLETVKLNCGAGFSKIEYKGNIGPALVEGASKTADVTKVTLNFKGTPLPCDTADKLCVELSESPLLVNFEAGFEKAEEITKVPIESNKMVLWDY